MAISLNPAQMKGDSCAIMMLMPAPPRDGYTKSEKLDKSWTKYTTYLEVHISKLADEVGAKFQSR